MNLSRIVFPVFQLEKIRPAVVDGVVFYSGQSRDWVVDDTTVPQATLGRRRLLIKGRENTKLYRLNNAIYFVGDLIKLTKGSHYYIDSTGYIFNYKKSRIVPLVYLPIEEIIPINSGGAIVSVKGIPQRFKCLYMPRFVKYAGLLKISSVEYILYGLYEVRHKDTRRKI